MSSSARGASRRPRPTGKPGRSLPQSHCARQRPYPLCPFGTFPYPLCRCATSPLDKGSRPPDRGKRPSSEGAKEKSLPLTREVAFAKQMTEGEIGRRGRPRPTKSLPPCGGGGTAAGGDEGGWAYGGGRHKPPLSLALRLDSSPAGGEPRGGHMGRAPRRIRAVHPRRGRCPHRPAARPGGRALRGNRGDLSPSLTALDSVPTPFVPSGHFPIPSVAARHLPLIRGVGPLTGGSGPRQRGPRKKASL